MTILLKLLVLLISLVFWAVLKKQFHAGIIEAGIIGVATVWAISAVNQRTSPKKPQVAPTSIGAELDAVQPEDSYTNPSNPLPKITAKSRIDKTYLWRRLFARLIDYQISALILSGVIFYTQLVPDAVIDTLFDPKAPPLWILSVWGFFSAAQWVVLEALFLSLINTTPGKILLGLKIVSTDNRPHYLQRVVAVWALGMGFAIPFISVFANLISANRAKRKGITDWDQWSKFRIEASPMKLIQKGMIAVLIAVIIGNRLIFQAHLTVPEHQRPIDFEQLVQGLLDEQDYQGEPLLPEEKISHLLEVGPSVANIPIDQRYKHVLSLSESVGPTHWKLPIPIQNNELIGNNSHANQWLEKLIELQKNEEITVQEQIEYCLGWVNAQPNSAIAWQVLGRFYKYITFDKEALDAYKRSLQLNPMNDAAWYSLGSAYESTNQLKEAIGAYKQAVKINPKNDAAWHFMGEAYENTNQYSSAIYAYEQVIKINPKFERITDKFQESPYQNGSPVSAWISLGDTYKKINQINKAFYAFQQALLINPNEISAWYSLGETYAFNGEQSKAVGVYTRLKAMNAHAAEMFFKEVLNDDPRLAIKSANPEIKSKPITRRAQ